MIRKGAIITLCLLSPAFMPAVHAAPAVPKAAVVGFENNVAEVQWRPRQRMNRWGGQHRRGGYRRHHRRGFGAGAVIGGIIASALIASAIREGRASDWDIERCDDRYRSFDRRSGTYVGYDGERQVCPYLY